MLPSTPRPRSSFQVPTVAVYMCDQRKHYDQFITHILLSVLQDYAPYVCDLIEPDILPNQSRLYIRLPLHAHVEYVEWAGLRRLLAHWENSAADMLGALIPRPTSIGDAVITYRSLQLMLEPEAETLRGRIMLNLRTTPITELDVQTIWWTFQGKPEWSSWLDALVYNLVRFQVLSGEPYGTAIQLFIETEMLNMDNAQYAQVLSAYELHIGATRPRLRTTLSRRVDRVLRRVFHA
ncbi:hypothetical protein T440DRAFT_59102 [Plenodomus tracheiphilus IPT5]|uniref:Uncharacterized protein n=1 Tax=Plenodomus tracheiphilus IPT5 TaxID=1408161 RepID=A0A6A7B8Y1_9PLEO|nr:hypothetical protein T440DRAFT_59102 [Plenodomus tracheiphilus IPT5]